MSNNQVLYKVSEIAEKLKLIIENDKLFKNSITVIGEISNLKNYKSRTRITYFFSLKDDKSNIPCVSFRPQLFINNKFQDGDKVTVTGKISLFTRDNKISFIVYQIKKTGLGDLHLKYEKLKRALQNEGLFNKSRKKVIPLFPERIGVITALNSAACSDVKRTILRRNKFRQIIYFDTTVQGETAPKSIIASLKAAEKCNLDVIIMCRGGGSFEDLFCFSQEKVIRQISNMNTPLVTGIGHEVDVSLADYASDLSCSTPTAAAEAITYVTSEMIAYIERLADEMNARIKSSLKNLYDISIRDLRIIETGVITKLNYLQHKIDKINNDIGREMGFRFQKLKQEASLQITELNKEFEFKMQRTSQKYYNLSNIVNLHNLISFIHANLTKRQTTINNLVTNLTYTINQKTNDVKSRFLNNINIINEANPEKILKRGYAILKTENNKTLYSIKNLKIGFNVNARMYDGTAIAEVKKIKLKGEDNGE